MGQRSFLQCCMCVWPLWDTTLCMCVWPLWDTTLCMCVWPLWDTTLCMCMWPLWDTTLCMCVWPLWDTTLCMCRSLSWCVRSTLERGLSGKRPCSAHSSSAVTMTMSLSVTSDLKATPALLWWKHIGECPRQRPLLHRQATPPPPLWMKGVGR